MKKHPAPLFWLKQHSRIFLGAADELLAQLLGSEEQVVIITDRKVSELPEEHRIDLPTLIIECGEEHKTLQTVEQLYRQLMELGVNRSWWIVGIGGGIVCDVAGFVASTYMRGVKFGFVATTLLAQVDASVGGKNGVNLGGYKNMVGCFSQPEFVICDPSWLEHLPPEEFRAGMAEVVKAAIIGDAELFERIEGLSIEQLQQQGPLRQEVIRRAIAVKVSIVERDEREQGERKLLNLGHTFAHAIEKLSPRWSHGEAVAIGLCMASEVAVKLGRLRPECRERIVRTVTDMGLPHQCDIAPTKLVEAMRKDKKMGAKEQISLILPTRIGHCETASLTCEQILDNLQ